MWFLATFLIIIDFDYTKINMYKHLKDRKEHIKQQGLGS